MQTNQRIDKVLTFLHDLGIEYQFLRHQAVVTCEDSAAVIFVPNCLSCKSLFVKDKKSDDHYMVLLPSDKRADMRGLAECVGCAKFEFATAQRLQEMLNTTRGSVSPFSLLYDIDNRVRVLVDSQILNSNKVKFHPNDNTATVVFKGSELGQILRALGKSYVTV